MVKSRVEESGGINPHIPEKVYKVRLAGVVEKTLNVETKDKKGVVQVKPGTNEPIMGDVVRWEWVFGLRQEDGKSESDIKFTHLTSPKISTKSNAYAFVKALQGEAPEKGKEFDTEDLVGLYADAVIKDKEPRKDRTGNIVQSSGISQLSPSKETVPPIEIDGLMEEATEETDPAVEAAEKAAAEAEAKAKTAADAAAASAKKKQKK